MARSRHLGKRCLLTFYIKGDAHRMFVTNTFQCILAKSNDKSTFFRIVTFFTFSSFFILWDRTMRGVSIGVKTQSGWVRGSLFCI